MSLVRSLTRRARAHTNRSDDSPSTSSSFLPRSRTVKYTPGTINRAKISLPTELLSTTNVDALNAPDIRQASASATSTVSIGSSNDSVTSESDFSSTFDKSFLTADTGSSIGGDISPITPSTPFGADMSETKDFFSSKHITSTSTASPVAAAPAIPQRAPSHSKKAHVELSRQRSFKRSLSPPPTDIVGTPDTVAIFSNARPSSADRQLHPFIRELAKVDEVAEGFGAGAMGMVLDEEEVEMMRKGLCKFSVADYLVEITGGVYEDAMSFNPWV